MDIVLLSRIQFALTIGFHYIFPPMSIGLGLLLVAMEGLYLRTREPVYERLTRFWIRIFGLVFAIGVATGIVMEFEFGTNWAAYARFVGDVFGSPLAAEGVFAFFLESCFLALLLFGWDRVKPAVHFLGTVMVCLGAHLSALWIIVANSWMQTPAGYHLVQGPFGLRAEITDFWAMVFNPSTGVRLAHTLIGAWQTGAFLMLAVCAWYLLRKRHAEFARTGFRIALVLAAISSLGSLATGHASGMLVARHQPVKLAAMEGHFAASAPADMHVCAWVDADNQRVHGLLTIPRGLSVLAFNSVSAPVKGLAAWPRTEWPPVQATFQTFHLMVLLGMALLGLSLLGLFLWSRGRLFAHRWVLWLFVFAALGPQVANQVGWAAAEIGRQPWIVYGLMRTADAVSPVVGAGNLWTSLVLFTAVYAALFVLFMKLLLHKIAAGPETD